MPGPLPNMRRLHRDLVVWRHDHVHRMLHSGVEVSRRVLCTRSIVIFCLSFYIYLCLLIFDVCLVYWRRNHMMKGLFVNVGSLRHTRWAVPVGILTSLCDTPGCSFVRFSVNNNNRPSCLSRDLSRFLGWLGCDGVLDVSARRRQQPGDWSS
jgi:hypothetical protein